MFYRNVSRSRYSHPTILSYYLIDIAGSEAILTKEKVQEMKDRYQLYQDVVYTYDDVEIEKTGVGLYEKTPYEDRVVGIAYTTWHTVSRKWGKGTGTWDIPLDGPYLSDKKK